MFDKSQIVFPMEVKTTCPFCHKTHIIVTDVCDYDSWQQGEPIQDVMPYLSADEREMLISGICPTCWDKMFSFDEDEVEEAEDCFEEEEDEPDYEDEPDEADLEMGFNPYMGGYDYDC